MTTLDIIVLSIAAAYPLAMAAILAIELIRQAAS